MDLLRRLLAVACLASMVLFQAGCVVIGAGGSGASRGDKGSGNVVDQSSEVSDFSSISLEGVGNVTVKQTGRESLTIRAEDNILPLLNAGVANGRLSLGAHGSTSPTRPIEFLVEVRKLDDLTLSGSGSIEATNIDVRHISVSISGSGDVTISGDADMVDIDISGSGSFHGENLRARQAAVDVSGVGNATVNASDDLDVEVSGVGSVEYLGSPSVRKSISGMGQVRRR